MHFRTLTIVAACLTVRLASTALAQQSTSTVTYQGRLTDAGLPVADGVYPMTFRVWDSAIGGQLIEEILVPNVSVQGGLFTAPVPITQSSITGEDQWWSIEVSDTELVPRQHLTAAPWALSSDTLAGGRVTVDLSTGNVGIGTLTPNSSVGHTPTLHIEGSSPGIKLRDIDPKDPAGYEIYVRGQYLSILNNRFGTVPFKISNDDLVSVKMISITGGSDLAEPFDVSTDGSVPHEPGMVVVIDPDNPGGLIVSNTTYDTRVAGVISGANGLAPGMVMSKEGCELTGLGQPIAMTGRVWVWCDADEHPIAPGDRLTTSPIPGHAMVATDRDRADGAVIGKAMTVLKEGRGLVLVLVNLQ